MLKRKNVFVYDDFNILHPGHLRFLKFAKQSGDYLTVGVFNDIVSNKGMSEDIRYGSTVYEIQAKGKFFITYCKYLPENDYLFWMEKFLEKGIERNYGVVKSIHDYISVALELISSKDLIVKVGDVYKNWHLKIEKRSIGKTLKEFYKVMENDK